MQISVLGNTEVFDDSGREVEFPDHWDLIRLLLGALADAASRGDVLRHQEAVDWLYPGKTHAPGMEPYERQVSYLRNLIGAAWIQTIRGKGYRLKAPDGRSLRVDLVDFRRLLSDGDAAAVPTALALVRGALLHEIDSVPAYQGLDEPRKAITWEYIDAVREFSGASAPVAVWLVDGFVDEPNDENLLSYVKHWLPRSPLGETLPDRPAWSALARHQLEGRTRSLRATLTGPIFLHPESYYAHQDKHDQPEHMERALRDFILDIGVRATSDVRLILRNTEHYIETVNRHVPSQRERRRFVSHCLRRIDEIWGPDGATGPDLCCVNTGISEVTAIFDHVAVSGFRRRETDEMEQLNVYRTDSEVLGKKQKFDRIFEANRSDRATEVDKLRAFVRSLDQHWNDY